MTDIDGVAGGVEGRNGDGASPHEPRWRRLVPDVLLALATILTIFAIVAIWANRLMLNPDNWANTSTQLLQNQDVRSATANYLVSQLYNNVDLESKIGDALPPKLQQFAGPISGALRSPLTDGVELALQQPVVQNAWRLANRAADQGLVTVVNGGTSHVSVNNGAVTLNIGQILNDVVAQVGLNVHLNVPPTAASVTVLRSDQLKAVQDGGQILRKLPVVLTLIVLAMYVAAMVIARGRRRRTLMYIGTSLAVAGLAAIVVRSVLVSVVPGAVAKDASVVPAVQATVSIATGMLVDVAVASIVIGLTFVVAAWFAGTTKWAVSARRAIAPYLRRDPVACYAIGAGLLLLIFIWQPIEATSRPLGILVFTVLAAAGLTVLRQQTAVEFPESPAGILPDDPTIVDGAETTMVDEPTLVGGSATPDPPTLVEDPGPDDPPE